MARLDLGRETATMMIWMARGLVKEVVDLDMDLEQVMAMVDLETKVVVLISMHNLYC